MKPNTTEAQMLANRKNAEKSTGPHNTESTRFNAVKHGLVAEGITELDQPEKFAAFLSQLQGEHQPEGTIEIELVRQIGMAITRIRRARGLEAESSTAALNPPYSKTTLTDLGRTMDMEMSKTEVTDRGIPARLSPGEVDRITTTFARYEEANENRLMKSLSHLERLQRARFERTTASVLRNASPLSAKDKLASFREAPILETAGSGGDLT